MAYFIDETPDAKAWVEQYLASAQTKEQLGRLVSAVIWTDGVLEDGEPVGGVDPSAIVSEINEQGWPLLIGHDPGLPAGRVIAARAFTSPSGTRFVAAVLVYYEPEHMVTFSALGIEPFPRAASPTTLRWIPGARIQFGVDRREVAEAWLDEVFEDAPLSVQRIDLSHNAAESVKELIRIGLPYAALVWNPLVKTIGEEAGKDIYAGIYSWLHKLWKKMEELRDPIVDVQSHHRGCTVSFLLRGRDVQQHYAAYAALSAAATQAAELIDRFKQHNPQLITLVYEYEKARWVPSYGIMDGGRVVSDRDVLIEYEQVPRGLSMGLVQPSEEKTKQPQVFLSYAGEDARIAHRIAEGLRSSGRNVILDARDLAPSGSLESQVAKSIAASDYSLVLISKRSLQSPWVQSELQGALLAEMNNRAITVIPVLIDQIEVPDSLRSRLYVDLSKDEESGIAQLQQQLALAPTINFSQLNYSAFEALVAALLSELGFETTGPSLSGVENLGADFSATFREIDPFGDEEVSHWLVQCKLYKQDRVTVTQLQKLFGVLSESSSHDHALVVTNGRLTSIAKTFVADSNRKTDRRLRVVDGNELITLLLKYPRLIADFFPQGVR
jgi:hypothetical protein